MNNKKDKKLIGIANLFDEIQIRSYFLGYLYFLIGIEILIFLITFMGSVGLAEEPFPWKLYFFASFTIPIGITFLLGIFIFAFNHYLFGEDPKGDSEEDAIPGEGERKSYALKLNSLVYNLRKIPFLAVMFLIIVGSLIAYNLDGIIMFVVNASEQVIRYILIAGGVLLVAGIIFGCVWLMINYRLRKKHMDHKFRYRNAVMEKMGLLIMDDETIIDREGRVISRLDQNLIEMGDSAKNRLHILPPAN